MREKYRADWSLEKENGLYAAEFAGLWGVSRSTHWRWASGKVKYCAVRAKRIPGEIRERVVRLDQDYRSTWDTRSIASVVKISHGSVAKILAEVRGPRPKKKDEPHLSRTRFLKRDVMWSSDFTDIQGGRKLLRTMDEYSRHRPGWDICRETAEDAVKHGEGLIACMGRAPLVWKYDHGSPFTSRLFQEFLRRHDIIGYATQARAPWTNGRTERDNREIKNWLIPVKEDVSDAELGKEVDEGMLMLNNIKPRAVLGYKTSADVSFHSQGVEHLDRVEVAAQLEDIKRGLEPLKGERLHRRAVRELLKKLGLYEEWEVKREAESVNRIAGSNVSI